MNKFFITEDHFLKKTAAHIFTRFGINRTSNS